MEKFEKGSWKKAVKLLKDNKNQCVLLVGDSKDNSWTVAVRNIEPAETVGILSHVSNVISEKYGIEIRPIALGPEAQA